MNIVLGIKDFFGGIFLNKSQKILDWLRNWLFLLAKLFASSNKFSCWAFLTFLNTQIQFESTHTILKTFKCPGNYLKS